MCGVCTTTTTTRGRAPRSTRSPHSPVPAPTSPSTNRRSFRATADARLHPRKALGNAELLAERLPADQVGHLVAAKLRRQAILYEPGREFVHIVGEAALHMRFGPMTAETLRAQLRYLAQMSSMPGHTFAVVPFRVGSPVEPFGFALYDHDLVRVETSNGVVQISDPEAVARHVRRVERLLEVALIGPDAAQFCRELADAMPDD